MLPLSAFQILLDALREAGHGRPYDEFTVEVNPEDIVDRGHTYVEGLLEMGVNRVSMGVQSFDDEILRFMNRRHDSATARKAYGILEDAGVRNISIDLIFGLPQLSSSKWTDTLNKALEISPSGILPQHISSYQLSVEPGSMLARMVEKGKWSEASEELCQQQYAALCDTLASAGYHHYEISNFAQPGFEARHNSAYWRHVPYVGLGPGAHSYISNQTDTTDTSGYLSTSKIRQWNAPDLHAYVEAYRSGDFSSVRDGETLDTEQLTLETIMLGLRTSEGLPESFLRTHCVSDSLSRALKAGHLIFYHKGGETYLRIPEQHFFISDSIITALV